VKNLVIPNKLIFLLSCWILLTPRALLALDPAKTLFQYNCQTWTHQDGLPVNRINSITQSRDGRMWFATQKGLVAFDGIRFKLVTLPSRPEFPNQNISCLSSCKDGGFWFGVASGSFGFFDGRQCFPFERQPWMETGMNVIAIRETGDRSIWVGSDKGAARLVKGSTNATAFFDQIGSGTSFYDDGKGRVWLGTVQRGLFYWENGELKSFPDESLKKSIIFTIAEDRQQRLWLGTENGPRCYDAHFQSNNIPETYNEVRALLVDREGVVWMGTRGAGLGRFQNDSFTFLRKTDGLASDSVTSLYQDQEGSIWVGTREGLSQVSDLKFPNFSSTEGILPGQCHGVAASKKGGLWVTLDRGLSWFDGKIATNFSTEAGLVTPYIKRAFEASNGDVYLVDGAKNIEILSANKIAATIANTNWPAGIAETSEGIAVSVGGDLFLVHTNELIPYKFASAEKPPMYWIYNLAPAREGGFWVASVNGLFHVQAGAYKRWGAEEGLSGLRVNWVSEDPNGVVWAGLTTGIARLKHGKVDCFNREVGLFDNYIYAIVPDDFGNLWVQSTRGIFRVSQKALDDFAAGKIKRIECTGYDGLEAVKTIDTTEIEAAACKTLDGRIWFPTPNGVVMIDPAHIYINSLPPPVYLERVQINGVDVTGQTDSSVKPGPGHLEINYAAASFITPQNIEFRYLLEGFDRSWIDAGSRRSAFYANLKPGKYRFRVQACNSDDVWNTVGAGFQFELLPHFYQTAWFKILAVAATAAALLGIYAMLAWHLESRQRKLEQENELLESKVRERTANLEILHK
jgi:ligand-binding sensor domain-containing protein